MAEQSNPKTSGAELIDFWAVWCGPCKVMEPILEELETEYKDKVTITKLNVDEDQNQDMVQKYNVMSIPTYLFVKDGEVIDQAVGAQSKATMVKKIEAILG